MDRKINVNMNSAIAVLFMMCFIVPSHAAFPEYFDFSENYYTVYGRPNLSASLVGDAEYSRGDSVTVNINLMNKGIISGFRSEQSADPDDDLEKALQQTEMSYEAQKTTAIGIVATLISLDPAVKVKTGPQVAGTLVSGQQTEEPVKFTVEIAKNARTGTYPLMLNLLYSYQENVQIDGKNITGLGITDLEVGLWYEIGNQNLTIPVSIKKEADFEITDIAGELQAGGENLIRVTYKNIGELPVKDATVRISVSDPFSTTDDQAFIGSLAPGESATAKFNLKVDDTATPKMYGLNSEIKYEDIDGHDRISDNIKIIVETLPAVHALEKSGIYLGLLAVLILIIVIGSGARGYLRKKGNRN